MANQPQYILSTVTGPSVLLRVAEWENASTTAVRVCGLVCELLSRPYLRKPARLAALLDCSLTNVHNGVTECIQVKKWLVYGKGWVLSPTAAGLSVADHIQRREREARQRITAAEAPLPKKKRVRRAVAK